MYTEAQKKTLEMVSKIGIIPVIAIDDAAEVTFRTAAAEDAIKAATRRTPTSSRPST